MPDAMCQTSYVICHMSYAICMCERVSRVYVLERADPCVRVMCVDVLCLSVGASGSVSVCSVSANACARRMCHTQPCRPHLPVTVSALRQYVHMAHGTWHMSDMSVYTRNSALAMFWELLPPVLGFKPRLVRGGS